MANVTVKQSLATVATDPLRNFRWVVSFTANSGGGEASTINFGFMNVQGLNVQIDVIAYREGGFNTTTQKMPGQADFSPIVMSHGVQLGQQGDTNWLKQLFSVMQGQGTQSAGEDFRATVDIKILDFPVTNSTSLPIKAWFRVYNAWPTAVSWSDLDAGANALLISQLSLAHEGFNFKLANSTGQDSVSF
jgi:phage tail-like protein